MTARTAIVTGATAGLGRAVAHDLAAAGWRLVVDARTATDLEAIAADLRTARAEAAVVAVAGDVADPAHRRALAAAAGDRVDLLVASAGTLGPSPLPRLADVPLPDLERTLRTNVVAQVGLVQEVLPALRAAGGVVVAVTSDAALEGYEGWGAYGASKAALETLALSYAEEVRNLSPVRVAIVDPGATATTMRARAYPGEDPATLKPPSAVAEAVLEMLKRGFETGERLVL